MSKISSDSVAWIINIVCQRPVGFGYLKELWTLAKLHRHIQDHVKEAGFTRLEIKEHTDVKKDNTGSITYCTGNIQPEAEKDLFLECLCLL